MCELVNCLQVIHMMFKEIGLTLLWKAHGNLSAKTVPLLFHCVNVT
jgi:hypothetical protein